VTAAEPPGIEWGADGTVTVAGRWTYHWGARKRPFVHPLTTPAGHVLTRDAPEDHPWHHGLWFTIKFVDDDNFWEEVAPYGVLRHDGPPDIDGPGDESAPTTVSGTLTWTRPDRETVALTEHRSLTHVPIDADAYAIDVATTLTPTTDVRLDRTEFTTWGGYGGLALRGPGDLHDTRLLLDDGSEHERAIGVPSRWLDLSGTVGAGGAEAEAGVAILDHPGNVRHPVPFYASTRADTYGDEGWSNFANAAFLWDGPLEVAAGAELALRYRVLVHDGRWDHARVGAEWHRWVAP
jgi:hypothetical protein